MFVMLVNVQDIFSPHVAIRRRKRMQWWRTCWSRRQPSWPLSTLPLRWLTPKWYAVLKLVVS